MMEKGKIKWFNPKKGYGFIIPENEERDLFFHVTSMQKGTPHHLTDGQEVSFEIVEDHGKISAENISIS